jgi:Tol biopolymer transport system component/imidazolonepropionase-like amidohydrolase
MRNITWWILTLLGMACAPVWAGNEEVPKEDEDKGWNVEAPPGPKSQQVIEVSEGTWISVDVSPDGETVVFDLLGDLYLMPIMGAEGSTGSFPHKLTEGMAWDMQPRFSPDGKRIAFTSDRTGASKHGGNNLWIIGINGKGLTQVTNETYQTINGPTWSPDGQYLVGRKHFTSRRSLGTGEIWLYHCGGVDAKADGGVQLTSKPNEQKDVNEPAYSPDGNYLYYSQDTTPGDAFEYDKDSNKQIYVIKRLNLETGEGQSYITGPGGACRPTPSHDGKQIAFVRRVGAKTGLHVFDIQSGAVRLVMDRLERDMQEAWAIHGVYPAFSWTPDDSHIVLWARGQIRKIRISDGTESTIPFQINDTRTVTEALRFPIAVAPEEFDVRMLRWVSVSPDGAQVVYQALGQLYIKELPDGEPQVLTTDPNQFAFCPSFSRDSKQLVYTTWNDETLGKLCVRSLETGNTRILTDLPGHYLDPVFSPDGKTIVFRKSGGGYLRTHLWSQEPGLYRVPTVGGNVERVSKSGSHPQFAASNERVFFSKLKRGKDADNLTLVSTDLQGYEERAHYTSKWATSYQLSPDGERIAFVERFNVYHAPFVNAGKAIEVAPEAKGLPITKLSQDAGDWIHFSDADTLHWALGSDLYSADLTKIDEDAEPEVVPIGFKEEHAHGGGQVALLGGKVISMSDSGVIEDSAIVIQNNRIVEVGPRAEVTIPADAHVVDVSGQVILPGFIDTHAHGSQASDGITPQRNWVDYARLSFGVTTVHDPSNNTQEIFAASEMTKAGVITAPRTFSTGTILYGATGNFKAEVASVEDATFHLKRMKAVGAFSVKSYNQPRRDQRQQIVAAARDLEMMVVPEGGSLFMSNMTMVVDGHTGVEHTLPVQYVYDDVMDLWRNTGVGYTPTLCVAYGGMSGEIYWYQESDLWKHPRLKTFIPPQILNPRSRRRPTAPLEDFNHIKVASITKKLVDNGNMVQAGGHGQLNGICTHWEMWSFVQGGMTPMESLRCGTLNGARYLGLDGDLGSIEEGKLADLIIIEDGYDPSKNIRHSERIQYVMANGTIYDAATMNKIGDEVETREPFFWVSHGLGLARGALPTSGCLHCRPGASRLSSRH